MTKQEFLEEHILLSNPELEDFISDMAKFTAWSREIIESRDPEIPAQKKRKKASKSVKNAVPAKMDYAGDWTRSNVWLKIGLSREASPMLKTIGKRIYSKPVKSALVARSLLVAALAHYDKIEPLIFLDSNYSKKEGFCLVDRYLDRVIDRQHAMITPAKKSKVVP